MNSGIWMMFVIMAAAAYNQRVYKKEEEQMTKYSEGDLQGWEFKIVRSVGGSWRGPFHDPVTLQKVIDEEARSGWVFLEKFDDYRIRFKRQAGQRTAESQSGIDPYRTTYGSAFSRYLFVAIALLLGLGFALLAYHRIR